LVEENNWSRDVSMKTNTFDKKSAALAICGIVGPITYAVVLTVIGMLWEGYNPVRQGMSELGAANAPHSFFMNVFGFQLLGVCMAGFGYGLHISSGGYTVIGLPQPVQLKTFFSVIKQPPKII